MGRPWLVRVFVTKLDKPTAAVASIEDAAACDERADALVSGLLTRVIRRRGTVATALDYVRSLGRDARANCWELAERAGHGLPYRMQGLLGRSRWRWEDLRELLPGLAQDVLAGGPGDGIGPGLAIDETADLRKGKATACVAPQHAGVTGKIENCVTWVFSALKSGPASQGQAWVEFYGDIPGPADRRAGPAGKRRASRRPWRSPPSRGTGHRAGQTPGSGRSPGAVGRGRRHVRPVRRVPRRPQRPPPVEGRSRPVRLPGHVARETKSPALTRRCARRCSSSGPPGPAQKGPRYAGWALLGTKDPREFLLNPAPARPR